MRQTQMIGLLPAKFGPAVRIRVILLSVVLAHTVSAAQTPSSLCDDDPSSALVFLGTLTHIQPDIYVDVNSATFHINELFEGRASDEISISVPRRLCKNEGTSPQIGQTYLIRTHFELDEAPDILQHCEQMRPANEASSEIEYFRSVRKGITPTEVHWDTRADSGKRVPVPGTTIHAVKGSKKWVFVSDDNGYFRTEMSPGQYKVTVRFPTGYEPYFPTEYKPRILVMNHLGSCAHAEFAIMEHLCTSVVLCGEPTGSITVRVADADGNSHDAPHVSLTLESAKDHELARLTSSDEEGNVVVERLLPGDYILGINMYDPGPPYRPTYYPGVSRRSEAQVINLRAGEHKVLPDMRIKRGTACQISVQVTDEFGHPSRDTNIALVYPEIPDYWFSDKATGENGRANIFVVFPGAVGLRAEKPAKDNSRIESNVIELTSCPDKPIVLKLSHRVTDLQGPQGN
ncbi:MAG TPA: carboxypeptidase-like regulatory domain-containing protein [Terriglobia bacterium]|nr:carboxypeptidase-like regulatory domain-containing protein [Terriglobia bacterium]